MRDIRFRFWNPKTKVMDYAPKASLPINPFPLNDIFFQLDGVYTQSTGLKDKNGKEIYEGDILLWQPGEIDPISKEFPFEKCQVVFHQGAWSRKTAEHIEPLLDGWIEESEQLHDEEIIGNIYENPELLTDTNAGNRPKSQIKPL